MSLWGFMRSGILQRRGCILIGANAETIRKAEDRELFKRCMEEIGLESARVPWHITWMKRVRSATRSAYPAFSGQALL